MMIEMLQCKVHGLVVTHTELHYQGSLTLDPQLLAMAAWLPGQKVQVCNVNTGARFETYLIQGQPGSRVCGLNGAAARLGVVGDVLLVMSFAYCNADEAQHYLPRIIRVDHANLPLEPVAALHPLA